MKRLFPLIVVLSSFHFFINMGCHPVPHTGEGGKILTVGKLEPTTLTLKPGTTGELKFSLVIPSTDKYFYTTDITWSLVDTPSYSVGTIASAPGQMPSSNFALGHFQALQDLPVGVERVTFKIKASYLTGTSAEVNATATVTLDVNAPTAAPLEIPASLTPVMSPALGPELPPGTTPNPG